jgi:hypothetical protein
VGDSESATLWPLLQPSRDDGSHALASVTYWYGECSPPSTPSKSRSVPQLFRSPFLCKDIFSRNLHGRGSQIFDLDQTVNIMRGLHPPGPGFRVTGILVWPTWIDLATAKSEQRTPFVIPSVRLCNLEWTLQLDRTDLKIVQASDWVGELAYGFLGSLALPWVSTQAKATESCTIRDKPYLGFQGVPDLVTAESILERVSVCYCWGILSLTNCSDRRHV